MASESWSQTLSGWPSVTLSLAQRYLGLVWKVVLTGAALLSMLRAGAAEHTRPARRACSMLAGNAAPFSNGAAWRVIGRENEVGRVRLWRAPRALSPGWAWRW